MIKRSVSNRLLYGLFQDKLAYMNINRNAILFFYSISPILNIYVLGFAPKTFLGLTYLHSHIGAYFFAV